MWLLSHSSAPPSRRKIRRELAHLPPRREKNHPRPIGRRQAGKCVDKNTDDGGTSYDVEIVRDGKERGFTVGGDNGELRDEEVFLT